MPPATRGSVALHRQLDTADLDVGPAASGKRIRRSAVPMACLPHEGALAKMQYFVRCDPCRRGNMDG
jgi:hypothetical protein